MKTKRVPERMCLGCSVMRSKREMVRVVKAPDGTISLDLTGKKAGRGAYICRSAECFKAARKARRFERSLSCRIDENIYEEMENELSAENN